MSRRGIIVLVIFILIVAGIIAASQFISNQPPLEITIAVDPLAENWVRQVAEDFNNDNVLINNTRRVRVNITTISDVDVWRSGSNQWSVDNHPDAWIPAHSASIDYLQNSNISMQIVTPSTARTLLVWGGYASRADVLTDNGTTSLDWAEVVNAAEQESWSALGGEDSWRFVNLAFALPDSTMNGLGVLFSGASAFSQTPVLSSTQIRNNELFDWFQPVINGVPNFNTIGDDVGAFFARSTASADIAITVESQWLNNLDAIIDSEDMRFSYPEYPFVFDFPLAQWESSDLSSDVQSAIGAFGDFLMSSGQQNTTVDFGLRPATNDPTASAQLFVAGEPYGIQLTPNMSNPIQPPSVNDIQFLIQQFQSAQRR